MRQHKQYTAIVVLMLGSVVAATSANAQPVVNCQLFRNPADQVRCVATNQAAAQAYRNERLATYGYYGAYGANQAGKFIAGRVVPGGSAAWGAGNYVGNHWATHPQTGRAWSPPPIQYPYPNIQGPPRPMVYQPPVRFQR